MTANAAIQNPNANKVKYLHLIFDSRCPESLITHEAANMLNLERQSYQTAEI